MSDVNVHIHTGNNSDSTYGSTVFAQALIFDFLFPFSPFLSFIPFINTTPERSGTDRTATGIKFRNLPLRRARLPPVKEGSGTAEGAPLLPRRHTGRESENEIKYLTEPLSVSAKKAFKLVFKLSDQNQRGLIAFKFPLYLKGITYLSHISLALNICFLSTFTFSHDPGVSDKTEQLLQGPITKLSFQLKPNANLNTFTATETNEPLVSKGAESGTVLDTVRSLSNATAFNAYIWATDLPESMLDRIISIVNNQLLNTQSSPNQFSTLLPGIQGKPISLHNEGQSSPSCGASNQIIPHDEPIPNVSSKRRCVSQGPDARPDIIAMIEDLRLEISDLKKQQQADRIDIKDLTCEVRRQETKALVIEIKVCEFEKERKKNKDKIVQIEDDIGHVQADVSAIDDRYKTHDADFLQTREEQEELVNRLDTIDEKQGEQKRQYEENMGNISEDLRRDVAKGLIQGMNEINAAVPYDVTSKINLWPISQQGRRSTL
ncbi:hypothetical protein ACKLNR_013952 [Fusarium oxysporum f. sp. zingiberi]